ncbi:MAG TPA: hypothetical protein VLH41_01660 [Thermoanaerobaculia bacterium]|nr:hypothetical protein [Thermoanaerobaculia bacterium]
MMLAPLVVLAQLASSHGQTVPAAPSAAVSAAGGLSWTLPKGWTAAPGSSMRVATYRVPAAKGDKKDGEVAVFFFGPGQGGSIDANVQRWFSQLDPEPGSKKPSSGKTTVGTIPVTVVEAEGTYTGGMGMGAASTGPEKGFALLGAIAEGKQGAVFFKLTGPKKTVAAAQKEFDALVKSLRAGS